MDTSINEVAPATADKNGMPAPDGYLRIGEMSRLFGVTLRTLRFYEDRGLIQPLREGPARLYSHRDCARLKLILLGRKVGFSLREVKQMMDLYDPAGGNLRQMRVTLEKSERQLARLEQQKAAIDEAIRELVDGMEILRGRMAGHVSRKDAAN